MGVDIKALAKAAMSGGNDRLCCTACGQRSNRIDGDDAPGVECSAICLGCGHIMASMNRRFRNQSRAEVVEMRKSEWGEEFRELQQKVVSRLIG